MENNEKKDNWDNLTLNYSEFQKRVVSYVINSYEKEQKGILPSLFIRSGNGTYKKHEMPPHFFASQEGANDMAKSISAVLKDYKATHACFVIECVFARVRSDDAEKIKKVFDEGVDKVSNKQQALLLAFEGKDENDGKFIFRFHVNEATNKLRIEEISEDGEADSHLLQGLILNLFDKE